ncbi:MAG: AbrB family transcriptional regulator [Geminicoccaceae bacterium]
MISHRLSKLHARYDGKLVGRLVAALVIGALGGTLFAWLRLPLPWMLGSMLATMIASLAGIDIGVPAAVRKPTIAVVGVILGSAFVVDRLSDMIAWLPSVASLPIYVLTIGIMILFYLRKVSGFDSKTAFFAATPGGLSEMVILSDQFGGDMRKVALFHSARLVLIVFCIPLLASATVGIESAAIDARAEPISLFGLIMLAGLGTVGWLLAIPFKLPAPAFMGPLLLSSVAHLTGLIDQDPPVVALAAAQLVIGSTVGARFSGVPLRLIRRTLTVGAGGALLMLGVTLIFALILHQMTGSSLALLILALIPGGFPEMSLIALAMGMDPAFVVTHHVVRVLLVVAFSLPIFLSLERSGWFARNWPT